MSNDSGKKTMESQRADNAGNKLKKVNKSRRSFAKTGFIAPVILSLANRPAWGASFRCTVSGFDSLATIGSGPALADVEAMCDFMSVNQVYNDVRVAVDQKVSAIFPSCESMLVPIDLTIEEALLGLNGSDELTCRLVAAFFNAQLAVNPFGNDAAEDVYHHCLTHGVYVPYSFGGVKLHGMEIHNFLGYVGIK